MTQTAELHEACLDCTRVQNITWQIAFPLTSAAFTSEPVIESGLSILYVDVALLPPPSLTAEEHPVLARIWDNEDDSVYDEP